MRSYICVTTEQPWNTSHPSVPLDSCWGHLANITDPAFMKNYQNGTMCLFNLAPDLVDSILEEMVELFSDSPIDCGVVYASMDTRGYVVHVIFVVLLILSILCLFATVVIYAVRKELITVPGLCIGSLCLAQLLHYFVSLLLIFNLPHATAPQSTCVFFGFVKHFTVLATFLWLVVMAYDIWATLTKMDSSRHSRNLGIPWKRLLKYSAFSWGMALLIAIIPVIFDQIPSLPETLRPGYDRPRLSDPDLRCIMSGNRLACLFLFNTIPRCLVLIVNGVFFALTIIAIRKVDSQTGKMRSTTPHRTRLRLFLKLFLVMGFAWILNVIENLVMAKNKIEWGRKGPVWLSVLSNYVTALVGVGIFISFGLPQIIAACCKTQPEVTSNMSSVTTNQRSTTTNHRTTMIR